MPQTKSAKKALRQSQKRRRFNLAVLARLKTTIKKFKKNPKAENFIQVQSLVDKTAKKGIISRNRGARIKSQLSKHLPKTKETLKTKKLPKVKKAGK